jgi:hypothetical protein
LRVGNLEIFADGSLERTDQQAVGLVKQHENKKDRYNRPAGSSAFMSHG